MDPFPEVERKLCLRGREAAAAAAVFEGTNNFGRRRRHQDGNRKLDDPGYRDCCRCEER